MNFIIDNAIINAMAVSRDGAHLAVAGRSLLKVYNLTGEHDLFGAEQFNLRNSVLKDKLSFSNNDVTWCPLDDGILATAATNGGIVIWNLNAAKSKIDVVFNDHKRTVNKVSFHSVEQNYLLSGSQDGCMKLFDLRRQEAVSTFVSNSESVRDVQFAPSAFSSVHFASVQDTGNVEIWDIRRTDKPEANFLAHDGPVFACEWHPTQGDSTKWLATGGRDKTIKVWDLTNPSKHKLAYSVHTIAPVSKLKWRPGYEMHIGSCSLVVDYSVYVWDIKRPYVPYAIFGTRKDVVTTGFAWRNDPFVFISSCKDGTVYQHRFETDAYYPAEHYPPIGLDINPAGDIAFSMTEFIHRYSQTLNPAAHANGSKHADSQLANQLTPGRAISLGQNSIITATGIMAHSNTAPHQRHLSLQTQTSSPYTMSSSLTQNNWDIPISTSASDMKLMNRVLSMGHTYLPSQFQYPQNSLQSNHGAFHNALSAAYLGGPDAPYNIAVPISYKTSSTKILCEHFRCMVSYMMFFLSKNVTDVSHGLLQNYATMKQFIEFASSYQLYDRTFEELCEFNASVADTLDRHQIAQTWRIVRHMFSTTGRYHTSSGGAANNPSGGSIANTTADALKNGENPSRHTSGGTRHQSGNNPPNFQLPASSSERFVVGKEHHDEDAEESHAVNDPFGFDSLKGFGQETIPSNRFAVDFFDMQPNVENEVNDIFSLANQAGQRVDLFNDYDSTQDWELQRESIMHRHNIADVPMSEFDTTNMDGNMAGANYDVSSPISLDEDEEPATTDHLSLFDKNLKELVSAKYPTLPSWPFTEIVTNMLRHYVDSGDVQTTISIILVMGDKMRQIPSIDKETVNIWYRSYIDLLNRYQLWNVSCKLIKTSPDNDIQAINQTSTTVQVYCAKCHKAIKAGTVCEKCSMEPANCVVCHVAVRGLYTWCQGCAHGGHMQHLLDWFKSNSLCPAGCGHHCELC